MLAQLNVAIVGSVTDEPLTDSKGPIGVHLTYQIVTTHALTFPLDPANA
jgi:hypothetical protein